MINFKKSLYIIITLVSIICVTSNLTFADPTQSNIAEDTDEPKPQVDDFYKNKSANTKEVSTQQSYTPTLLTDLQTITADHKYRTKFFVNLKKIHSVCGNNIECLEKYANLGDPKSQLILGLLAYNKAGNNKLEATKGVNLIKQSANLRYAYAQFILGQMYVLGAISVEPDRHVGYILFHEAANNDTKGYVLNTLGTYSLNGSHGVPYNITNAKSYFAKASKLGYVESTVNLGLIYFSGTNMNPNLATANKYFEQACLLDNVYGCYYQAIAILQDNHSNNSLDKDQMQLRIAKDILIGKTYTRRYHRKYTPTTAQRKARYKFNHDYNLNRITRAETSKTAFEQLKNSALQGNTDAVQTIIGYYMKGFGISQNRIRGIAWAKVFNDLTYDNTLYIMNKKQSPQSFVEKSEPIYEKIITTIIANQAKQKRAEELAYDKETNSRKIELVTLEANLTGEDTNLLTENLNNMIARQNTNNNDTVESAITESEENENMEIFDDSLTPNSPVGIPTAKEMKDSTDHNLNSNTSHKNTSPIPTPAHTSKSFIIDDNVNANLSTKEKKILTHPTHSKAKPKHKTRKKHTHQRRVCSIKVIKKLKANPNKKLLKYFCVNG